jgi:hypothetical protein
LVLALCTERGAGDEDEQRARKAAIDGHNGSSGQHGRQAVACT